MNSNLLVRTLVVAGVATALAAGYSQFGSLHAAQANTSDSAITNKVAPQPAVSAGARNLPEFTRIVDSSGAAVVNISVTQNMRNTNMPQAPQLDPSDPFNDFFRRFQPGPQTPQRGSGSGFIISPEGLILTNAHVVAEANDVTVKLTDRREFQAKVIGYDRQSDVAVIKIDGKNLPTVKLGNPADVKVGEWVVAIGSPFGFENTVTAGIVSAKSRSLPDETYVPFIQTDVAVNPGNSGGPLFNLNGEVIGINSQIYSRTGGYQGLSFAIPIDVAVNVKDQLLAYGKVTRGRLGVAIQDLNQSLAESFGLKQAAGALVSSVERDSPAAKAGLEPGDVITTYNGSPVASSSELPRLVAATKPGSHAKVDIWRKGATKQIDVQVGEMMSANVEPSNLGGEAKGRLGLALRPLSPEEARSADLQQGLVVEQATGPAAQAGIRAGDVVLMFNNTPVKSVEQLRELAAKAKGRAAVLVARDGNKMFVPIELG